MSGDLSEDQAKRADGVLAACARGELSPPLALTRLLLLVPDPTGLRRWLEAHKGHGSTAAMLGELLKRHGAGTAAVLRLAAAQAPNDLSACARLFDRAVAASPAAAVATYSLGDATLLAAATAEVADLLDRLDVLGAAQHLLDVGCGIGRLEVALSARVGAITGIDLSPGMIREARARCAGLVNVSLLETDGRDLRAFTDASFDAVIAVDSFPYLFQAGGCELASAQVAEAARVLRPGGALVVLNLSYRGELARDRDDAARMAAGAGLELMRNGTADLALWDGRTFHFRLA